MTRFRVAAALWLLFGAAWFVAAEPAQAQAPASGGHLNIMLREDLPQGFAVHETATISTSFPSMPCFSNLVLFDQLKRVESPETLVGELAEKWSWQDGYRNLVFFLRKDVKWHDGKPFTSKDVKFTFDMVREAPETQAKLRINPRKDWYANVEAIEAAGIMTELDAHTLYIIRKHSDLKEIYGEAPNALRAAREGFLKQVGVAAQTLSSHGPFILGKAFTGADILLTTCLTSAVRREIPLTDVLRDYMKRTTSREAYQLAYQANHIS